MRKITLLTVFMTISHLIFSQVSDARKIGKASDFVSQVATQLQKRSERSISIYTNKGDVINGKINITNRIENGTVLLGTNDKQNGDFRIVINDEGDVSGSYNSLAEKVAYNYYTDIHGDLYVEEEDINDVICVDFVEDSTEDEENFPEEDVVEAQPDLQSLPDCPYVIYIDMDGEVSTSRWAGGQTINAQPMGFTQAQMTQVWELVAEDFKPFYVNVTTNRAVYDAVPFTRRMMCICTRTNTAAPGAGGVAYVRSFSWNEDVPCWTFNTGVKACAETTSHEIGHTLGLSHDGTRGGAAYYGGHGNWAPIMGNSMSRAITHWSRGEYNNADNTENDLNIITTANGFGYRQDDVGNTTTTANDLVVNANGQVTAQNNSYIIERNTDVDIFRFEIGSAGTVNLITEPHPTYPNLNIRARLLNASGTAVQTADPSNTLSATINGTFQPGIYYLAIDGVGDGANPSVGYSDYNSMGMYTIRGTVPPPNPRPIAAFSANKTEGCKTLEVTFQDVSTNNPTSWNWTFSGGTPASSTQQNPTVQYNTPGVYSVTLSATNNFGESTTTEEQYIRVINPASPLVNDFSVCAPGGEVTLTAQSVGDELNWYTSTSASTPVNTGGDYNVNVSQNTTYYLSSVINIGAGKVGHSSPELGDGGNHQGGFYLVMDVQKTFTLKSALVQATGTKERTLEVRNAAGNILLQKQIMINDGTSRIDIDVDIPVGNNLQIGFATGADLFRSNAGISYPYAIDGVVNIKNSTATAASTDYYYYLYDWEITTGEACESERVPLIVTLEQVPVPIVLNKQICSTEIGSEVIFEAAVEEGNQAFWYDSQSMTTLLGIGDELAVIMTQDTVIYVSSVAKAAPQYIGHLSPSVGDGGNHQGGFYMIIDVSEPVVLKSTLVRAVGAKNRTLQLRDSGGNVLTEKTIFIPDGESRVELDFELPVGTDLQIGFATGADLFRTNQGVVFPYEIEGLMSVKSSTAADQGDFYYYLYNMEIEGEKGCASELVAVEGKIDVCTGLNEIATSMYNVYPTHFTDIVNLNTLTTNAVISVRDTKGVVLYANTHQGKQHRINLGNLEKGFYYLVIEENNNDREVVKLVKN